MENIKNKKGIIALASIILLVVAYLYVGNDTNGKLKIPFPVTFDVSSNTSFACESLMSATLIGSEAEYLTNGIEGEVERGTDKIAMKIKDAQTLEFLTVASLEIGVTEGSKFVIVQNDREKLIAAYFNESDPIPGIDTLVLNKKNGLALWTKAKPEFLGSIYGAPGGMVFYLICR